MSYQKFTWEPGDKITAARLNNIQEGIEERSVILKHVYNADDGSTYVDASYQEIKDILNRGKAIYFIEYNQEVGSIEICYSPILVYSAIADYKYILELVFDNGARRLTFNALNADDYLKLLYREVMPR